MSLLNCSNSRHASGDSLVHPSHRQSAAPRVQKGIEGKRVIRVQIRGILVNLLSSRSKLGNAGFRGGGERSHVIVVI